MKTIILGSKNQMNLYSQREIDRRMGLRHNLQQRHFSSSCYALIVLAIIVLLHSQLSIAQPLKYPAA